MLIQASLARLNLAGSHRVKKKAQIWVIGSGEAFSSTEGNTSYLFKYEGHPTLLFDCGYQIPERLWRLKEKPEIDAICLTHLHADHVFGIVPFLCREWEEGRKKVLTLIGAKGCSTYVQRLFETGYPGLWKRLGFKIEFLEIAPLRPVEWAGLKIRVAETSHSVRNFTYRVDSSDGSFQSFAVSGDGQTTSKTCELVKDVGVHFQEIYTLNKINPVHMDLKRFEKWALRSRIEKIGVAHHSRAELDSIQARIKVLAKQDPRWFCVKPGMKISLV